VQIYFFFFYPTTIVAVLKRYLARFSFKTDKKNTCHCIE